MSTVKVGDRVRATCGESVIIGACARGTFHSAFLWVTPDGTDVTFICNSSWAVEVLAPPIPDVVGTIVRDSQGDAWQRADVSWQCAGSSQRFTPTELQENYGPLTVLWTPEATP